MLLRPLLAAIVAVCLVGCASAPPPGSSVAKGMIVTGELLNPNAEIETRQNLVIRAKDPTNAHTKSNNRSQARGSDFTVLLGPSPSPDGNLGRGVLRENPAGLVTFEVVGSYAYYSGHYPRARGRRIRAIGRGTGPGAFSGSANSSFIVQVEGQTDRVYFIGGPGVTVYLDEDANGNPINPKILDAANPFIELAGEGPLPNPGSIPSDLQPFVDDVIEKVEQADLPIAQN